VSTLTIAEAIEAALAAVEGLTRVQIGELATYHAGSPVATITLAGQGFSAPGQISARRPRYLVRVWLLSQDFTEAERDLLTLADRVVTAIEADPQLGGAVVSGLARIIEQTSGWAVVAGSQPHRILDTTIEVVNKVAYGS
jgi:hypothetical protein